MFSISNMHKCRGLSAVTSIEPTLIIGFGEVVWIVNGSYIGGNGSG